MKITLAASVVLILGTVSFAPASFAQDDNKPDAVKESAPKEPALRKELLAMVNEEQEVRAMVQKQLAEKGISPLTNRTITDPALMNFVMQTHKKQKDLEKKNQKRLMQIMDKHGWPGKSLVGFDGANAAWLIVQQGEASLDVQRRCLALMKKAAKDEVEPKDVAYLTDRVRLAENKKQVYGTQLVAVNGVFKPRPLEDPANVDKRRAEVGPPTLAEYLQTAQAEFERLAPKKK